MDFSSRPGYFPRRLFRFDGGGAKRPVGVRSIAGYVALHPARVLIADGDADSRGCVEAVLGDSGYLVASFATGAEVLTAGMVDSTDCAVIDLDLPDMDSLDLQRQLLDRYPCVATVCLTAGTRVAPVVAAILNGSVDVLEKPVPADILLAAVDTAIRQSREARRELAEWARATGLIGALTRRERQVMEFVIAGYRNKEIARWLGITEKTVKVHRARVFSKTTTTSVAELVRLCTLAGIEPRVLNPMGHGDHT